MQTHLNLSSNNFKKITTISCFTITYGQSVFVWIITIGQELWFTAAVTAQVPDDQYRVLQARSTPTVHKVQQQVHRVWNNESSSFKESETFNQSYSQKLSLSLSLKTYIYQTDVKHIYNIDYSLFAGYCLECFFLFLCKFKCTAELYSLTMRTRSDWAVFIVFTSCFENHLLALGGEGQVEYQLQPEHLHLLHMFTLLCLSGIQLQKLSKEITL